MFPVIADVLNAQNCFSNSNFAIVRGERSEWESIYDLHSFCLCFLEVFPKDAKETL